MKIEIVEDGIFGYDLLVDGETILECMSGDEISDLTIGEIQRVMMEAQYL